MEKESEIRTITRLNRIFYDTYASLPTTNLRVGEAGFATDRKVLYRWSGAAWESIGISSRHGNYAAIGDPAHYPESSLYQADDTDALYMLVSGAWKGIVKKQFSVGGLTWHNQLIPATGTEANPEYTNDNDTGTFQIYNSSGHFQILFPSVIRANKLRTYTSNTTSPHFKVEYRDSEGNWQTLIADFEPNGAGSWEETVVSVSATDGLKISWISGQCGFREVELVYS